MRNIRAIDLQDRGQRKVSPLELGLVELPTRPLNTYTAAVRHEAILSADQGNLTAAADLTRAAMTEDGYARGVLGSLVYGLWGLPMNFIGDPAMIAALTDSPKGAGEWRTMFPQPEAIRLMSWGVTLGVGIGQMRRRYCEPGEDVVSVEEAEDGTYKVRRPLRPIGANNTRVLRTWDPKNLRHQYWDDTWWLMTADGEIRITPNDGEWILYTPYGEVKPWEYGAWKALTLAFVLGRDGIFDRSRHAEKLAPIRVGKVPAGTTERQRRLYLKQIREMQRMGAFVLPPGLEYSIVEGTGRIVDIYEQVIAWAEKTYCLIFTGNETTTTGSKGFSSGDVQERIAKTTLKSFAGSFASCLHDGGLVDWSVQNYATNDPPLAFFDCDPPEDKLARAKTVSEAGDSILKMTAGLKEVGLRLTAESATAYAQSFGFAVELIPASAAAVVAVKINVSPTDVAKVFTANEIRASEGAGPTAKTWGDLTIPELDAAATTPPALPGSPIPTVAAPQGPAVASIAASEDDAPPTDESASTLAAKMTAHAVERCGHNSLNRCLKCGVERERDFSIDATGAPVWAVKWRPIVRPAPAAVTTEAYGYNPDQERADNGEFGEGAGSGHHGGNAGGDGATSGGKPDKSSAEHKRLTDRSAKDRARTEKEAAKASKKIAKLQPRVDAAKARADEAVKKFEDAERAHAETHADIDKRAEEEQDKRDSAREEASKKERDADSSSDGTDRTEEEEEAAAEEESKREEAEEKEDEAADEKYEKERDAANDAFDKARDELDNYSDDDDGADEEQEEYKGDLEDAQSELALHDENDRMLGAGADKYKEELSKKYESTLAEFRSSRSEVGKSLADLNKAESVSKVYVDRVNAAVKMPWGPDRDKAIAAAEAKSKTVASHVAEKREAWVKAADALAQKSRENSFWYAKAAAAKIKISDGEAVDDEDGGGDDE